MQKSNELSKRTFLKAIAAGTAGLLTGTARSSARMPVMDSGSSPEQNNGPAERKSKSSRKVPVGTKNDATPKTGDASTRPGWRLVWGDEFEGKRLDPAKWNVVVREQSKHDELQYYVRDEVYIEHGCLRLRSRKRDYGGMHYTSGRVETSHKFAATYGRFEIRAKLPGGKGMWPAYWLYPQNRDWAMERLMAETIAAGNEALIPEERPWYSEIDIMESLGHETNVIYGTLHYYTFKGEKKSSSGTWRGDDDYTRDFHVYALEWEPDAIRWYVDDKLIHTTVTGIPHTPHYLILNTAVGGKWPGNPDDTTVFPQFHDVDYVRVYQRVPSE